MAYENDPNRIIDPDRPRVRHDADTGFGWVPMILAVAAVAILIMLLLPTRNDTGPRVTENTSRTERPVNPTPNPSPPANKPAPTTPAPTPPQ